ncbi:MAG: valine--tRNA ligase [bacterium]
MKMIPRYNPADVEDKWYSIWEQKGHFRPKGSKTAPNFCIVIPPPNVTGILHMGHALNNTIQDILIRKARMDGMNALWIPGTDHAGIATQNVVEKELKKKGSSRDKLGRQAFVDEVWKWKEHYQKRITGQLRKLGCSCDWTHERFTMDEGLSKAVRRVFVQLYKKDLIYKGKYIINWCPRCTTALSDEEAEHQEDPGFLWYIKYPLRDRDKYIEIATTRPETMLGDTAVAVNPKDQRYSRLIGEYVILPLVNREIPIIADDYVETEFGTGALKITPAHDPSDFEIGIRHNLEPVVVISPDGTINENGGKYRGLDRFKCREMIIKDLEKQNLLSKIEKYKHSVGHCYRCNSVVEPYLSDQWFVKMKPLAQPGIMAAEQGDIIFFPKTEKKKYLDWMYNIRDWCISRQIWWGHKIPAWTCADCGHITVEEDTPSECKKCRSRDIKQEVDVLDTWFSSWLWPFSTMGWPEKSEDLQTFYPTNVLATAPDIIFFWVARMIMAGYEFMGGKPFSHVYIHGVVRDDKGRKMSKSLGNSIDPLSVINDYGTDALRFTLVANTPQGKDVYLKNDKRPDGRDTYPTFEIGRNFCNKLWNAARFVIQNIEDFSVQETGISRLALELPDHWILSRLCITSEEVQSNYNKYRLNDVAQTLSHFIKDDFCDWYVEMKKHLLYTSPSASQAYTARYLLLYVLINILKMLHPVTPFITEEIWSILLSIIKIKDIMGSDYLIQSSTFKADPQWIKMDINAQFTLLQEAVITSRRMRKESGIPLGKTVDMHIRPRDQNQLDALVPVSQYIKHFAKISHLEMDINLEKPKLSKSEIISGMEIFLILDGIIDINEEKNRKEAKILQIREQIGRFQIKLQNRNFQTRAPREVIEKEKKKLESMMENLEKMEKSLVALNGK